MTHSRKFSFFILLAALFVACKQPTTTTYMGQLDSLVPNSSLIFKAKIDLLHTTTTEEDDVTNAGVVTVTEIIDAPPSLQNISGQQVTVRFANINNVKVGDERLFFTEPYSIGESLGVTENNSVAKDDKLYNNKDIVAQVTQARTKQDEEQLKKLLKDARLVVSGRVIRTQIPEGYTRQATEHDPEWKLAEIQVDEFIKGSAPGKTITTLFPSSNDVMYFDAPKLKENDEGVFIFQPTDSLTLRILKTENMLTGPGRFLRGKERAQHIKTLLK